MSTRRLRTIAAAIVVALLVATASCSSGGAKPGAAADGGGVLTVAPPIPIESLDPSGASSMDAGTQLAARAIFSQLVIATGAGKFKPGLADKWTPSNGARKWTLELREGVKYSDGTAVTSKDVVTSFKRVLASKGPLAGNFGGYKVAAKGDATVVFTSKTPDPSFLGKISSFFVTPHQAGEKGFYEHPIGSGPFTVKSFVPGQKLQLAANPTYWDGKPKLKELVFRSIPEMAARTTALQTGEVDVAWSIPDDQLAQLKSDSNLSVKSVPSPGVFTMWMNSSVPALKSAKVRRALRQAVDFKSIIASLYPETGSPADSVISPSVFGYSPQTPVKYDPAAAKAALDAAGFDYNKTTIRFQYSQPKFRQFVQAVVSDLEKVGVKAEPLEKEQAVFLDDLLALKWDMNLQQIGSQGYDPATNLGRLYPCAAKRTGYCNKDLDKLLAEAGSTSDQGKRQELYGQATKIIWEDAVGMYPMFVKQPYVWRKSVQGLELAPDGEPNFAKVTVTGD